MKRVLIISSLLVLAATGAKAQSYPPPASKAGFSAKTNLLNSDIAAGKITNANADMDSLYLMIGSQIQNCTFKIQVAASTGNTTATAAAQKNMADKTTIYNDLKTLTSNVVANQAKINTDLSNFLAIMD